MAAEHYPESIARIVPARKPSNSTTSGVSAETDPEKQEALSAKGTLRAGEVRPCDVCQDGEDRGDSKHNTEKLLTWWQAAFYMIAYNISIGILALPKAFSELGLAGGLLYLIPYALLNYYTSKTVWLATQRHGLYSYPDILGLIFGRGGEWFGHLAQSLLQGFLMAVHVMAMRKAIVAISAPRYVACAVWWTFLGAGVMFLCSLYRSLKDCAWLAVASCASILAATIITIISVVSNDGGTTEHFVFLPDSLSSSTSVGAGISSIVFAFTGHLAYPQIIDEMAKPEDFPKALKANATVQAVMYAASACIIYWFAGDAVEAPALDSATGILGKLAWGLAIPTVIVAGVLPAMMIIKNANRGFWTWRQMPTVPWENTWRARASWMAIAGVLWVIAPVFAEVVPSFMGVVGVAGAFLGSWISLSFPALAWFRIDRTKTSVRARACSDGSDLPITGAAGQSRQVEDYDCGGVVIRYWRHARINAKRSPFAALFNVLLFALGVFLCVFGAYGAISDMANTSSTEQALRPFSCRAPASLGGAE